MCNPPHVFDSVLGIYIVKHYTFLLTNYLVGSPVALTTKIQVTTDIWQSHPNDQEISSVSTKAIIGMEMPKTIINVAKYSCKHGISCPKYV